nr:DedA family protein [Paenibacillus lemnae]
MFFSLWLGIVGMPLPDEVIVMTGGAVTGLGYLAPVPAFILTYLGVISGLSLGYVLGRSVGAPILTKLGNKRGMTRHIAKSEGLIRKYGGFALCISYFFPIVRHVIPYLVGINKMPFHRYATISYLTGLVWTAIFFSLGSYSSAAAAELGSTIYNSSLKVLGIVLIAGTIIAVYYKLRGYKKKEGASS